LFLRAERPSVYCHWLQGSALQPNDFEAPRLLCPSVDQSSKELKQHNIKAEPFPQ
jgi:hypothetical protein